MAGLSHSSFDWDLLFRLPRSVPIDDQTFPGRRFFRNDLWYLTDGVFAVVPLGKLASFWWVKSIASAELASRGTKDPMDISDWPEDTYPLPPIRATIATDLTHRGIERRAKEAKGGNAQESIAFDLRTGKDLYSTIAIFESTPFRRRLTYDYAYPLKSEGETPIKITFGLKQNGSTLESN